MKFKIDSKTFLIRKCNDLDYTFVRNILKRNMMNLYKKHWGGFDSKVFRDSFNKNNIKIIECNNKRIAYYDISKNKDHLYLNNIQISAPFRGKGLGAYLMKLIENETKRKNIDRIKLLVFKDNKAIKLYEKMTYVRKKDKGSSIIMEKKI